MNKGNLELAVVGNCQVAGLIDSAGRMVWACLPRPDGDPVLCALLQRDQGECADGVFAVDLHDQSAYYGAGFRFYLTRRFFVRGEYKNRVVFTSRNDNEELEEWKVGLAFFF